jgi:hypothetical protein
MFKFFIVFHTYQNNPNNFQQISQNKLVEFRKKQQK